MSSTPPIFSIWDLHHVHADPAAGNIGDCFGRREPRLEDEVQRFPVAQLLGLLGPQEPFVDGLLLEPRDVDSRAVIADFDVDLSALVIGAQGQRPFGRLARSKAGFRRLDAVIARVTDQVHERIFDRLDDSAVEFGLGAFHFEPNLLAEGYGDVANHARQLVPDHPDGLHAGLHDTLLQFGGNQVQTLRGGVQGGVFPLVIELENLVAGEHQLAHQIHELVE